MSDSVVRVLSSFALAPVPRAASVAVTHQQWHDLQREERDGFTGKLSGLWGATSDEAAFNSLPVDKQRALFLILRRMRAKQLWQVVRKIENLYGEGGVGMTFIAWPLIESTLSRRADFTRLFATHEDTDGGFYERGRAEAVLHFLYQEGSPRKWSVHFDLYSPVHSVASAFKHFRHEFLGKLSPDWRIIQQRLKA
jgi:hypothetical protein